MGCDIHGYIEVNRYPTQDDPDGPWAWDSAVNLERVVGRCYRAFARLAHDGRRQYDDEIALFAGRGLPPKENLGDDTREWYYEKWEADAHHEAHFTHAELTQDKVRIGVGGEETTVMKPIEYVREGLEEYNPENPDARNVREDSNNEMIYGRKKREWEAAFSISEALAESNGHEQVRWVIWFDN